MIKTEAVRFIQYGVETRMEQLYIPDDLEYENGIREPKWELVKSETSEPSVSDFSTLQVGTAWPFPESST